MRTYYITGWELLAAIETKTVKNLTVKLCSWFNDTGNFKKYTDKFWTLRRDEQLILLTGTPVQNCVRELFSLLNVIDADTYSDEFQFLERYGAKNLIENANDLKRV